MADETLLQKRLAQDSKDLTVYEYNSTSSSRFVVVVPTNNYGDAYIEEYSPDGKRLVNKTKVSIEYALRLSRNRQDLEQPAQPPQTPVPNAYDQKLSSSSAAGRVLEYKPSGTSSKYLVAYEGSAGGRATKIYLEEYTPDGTRRVSRTEITADYAQRLVGSPAGAPLTTEGRAPSGPVTAGQRNEQGVMAGAGQSVLPAGIDFGALAQGTPTSPVAPSTTPPATQAPASTQSPAGTQTPAGTQAPASTAPVGGGMTVTNPATGQPVTLPAGIDFAWLASQTPTTPPAWEQAAIELYGGYYEVIKNIPELRDLIGKAMSGGWGDDKFQYELEQTTWWKTTTASARAWEEQKVRDPASLQTVIDNKTASLRDQALTLGIRIDDASISKLAEDSLKFGWSDQVTTNAIGMEAMRSQSGVSQLRQGYYGQTVKAIASNYGVPLSDTAVNQWIGKIASGQENEASFQAYVRDLSKNLYPSLSSGFDRGLTFNQMTDPYAQVASNLLEIPSSQVDFTDPKWAAAFTMKDSKGQQVQMSFGEWADYLRTNPSFGYEYTDGARDKAYQVVNDLAKAFGAA